MQDRHGSMLSMKDLIGQRKKDIAALTQHRRAIAGELCHITVYVRDNIVKVQQLCEDAISNLARLQVGGKRTEQLIEDIKEHFKGEVRDHRQAGMVTPEYLESVKAEVADLSLRLKRQLLGDIYAVTGIYEAIYDHVKNNAALLTELIERAERARKNDVGRNNEVFGRIERALIALISEIQAEVKAPALPVCPDVEDGAASADQLGLDAELSLQVGCQPGSPRLVVSGSAVLDGDVHLRLRSACDNV